MEDFLYLAKTRNYSELCCIEDALKNFSATYPENERGQLTLTALRQKVTFARGWAHHDEKNLPAIIH